MAEAFHTLKAKGEISKIPISDYVASVSVGIVDGQMLLDLNYEEDSKAEVDMNFVMTGSGLLVEIQGTAERKAFSKGQIDKMTELASKGIEELIAKQRGLIGNLF